MALLPESVVHSLMGEYVQKALEIAEDRHYQAVENAARPSAFDESQLPYKEFFEIDFRTVERVPVRCAYDNIFEALDDLIAIRKRIAKDGHSFIYWTEEASTFRTHCICDEIEVHFEAEQVLHMAAGRNQFREDIKNDVEAWCLFKARDYAFWRGVELLNRFFAFPDLFCDCRDRMRKDLWSAITIIIMHSGARKREIHDRFLKSIMHDIDNDESLLYYLALFEDYRANHGLTNNGQILGGFVAYENGHGFFNPPLINPEMTDKLRKSFGMVSAKEYLETFEKNWTSKRLHFDTLD